MEVLMDDVKLDYSDVLLVPGVSKIESRADVILEKDDYISIIGANMDGVGTFEMAKALGKQNMLTALSKHYTLEELVSFYTTSVWGKYAIYSMGITHEDQAKWLKFYNSIRRVGIEYTGPHYVCIDVANGYTKGFEKFVGEFAEEYPEFTLMVGNVCTPERVMALLEAGADYVKVGIGPGSVCTTRKMTGVGYPQFSAVLECSKAAHSVGGGIIADGGITCPGDAAKAFGAGADFIMLGGYLAGHDEGGGENIYPPAPCGGRSGPPSHKRFYGMASKEAQYKHNGGVKDYRASEGKEVLVPYKGPVENTVKELLGGLRSACAYIGSPTLADMPLYSEFIRVNNQLNNVFGVS
jgi:GMP reductase